MRQKYGRILLLTALSFLLVASSVWAETLSRYAIRRGEARGLAHYIMGYSDELKGAVEEALDEYRLSVKYDGMAFASQMRLAMTYAQLSRFSEAILPAQEAAKLNPQDMGVRYFLALVYSQLKQDDKASAEYEAIFKALAEKNPGNREFPIYLGQLYYSSGKKKLAMEQFTTALRLDPKNCDLLYMLGTYYLDTDNHQEGLKYIKECLIVNPANADCLNSLAYTYAEDNVNLDEALEAVQDALKVEPENAAFIDTLGWVYYRKGSYDAALKELTHANGIIKDPTILEHIVAVYSALGNTEEVRKYQQEKEQAINAKTKEVR